MICIECTHSIIRVLWDGVSENEVIHCELDNVQVSRQMRKCSRANIPIAKMEYVLPPKIVEPEPPREYFNVTKAVIDSYSKEELKEVVADIKRKPGNPNWVKRGT